MLHPVGEKGDFFHKVLGNVSGKTGASGVCNYDVKITLMVGDIQYRLILWYPLLADDGELCSGNKEYHFKRPLDDTQAADICGVFVEFLDNALCQHNRNGSYQKKN